MKYTSSFYLLLSAFDLTLDSIDEKVYTESTKKENRTSERSASTDFESAAYATVSKAQGSVLYFLPLFLIIEDSDN